MESLVSRWKTALNSRQQNTEVSNNNSLKKSVTKSNNLSNSKDVKSQRKQMLTKIQINSKQQYIQNSLMDIINILGQNKVTRKISQKIKIVLEELWDKTLSYKEEQNKNQSNKQSGISVLSKHHQRLYQDLQKKYIQSQKQKHSLNHQLENLTKKYQGIDKQLQRHSKIEKLIDNALYRQQQAQRQIKRLRLQLQLANKRQTEQQIIFKKQVSLIQQLINSIKTNIPKQ